MATWDLWLPDVVIHATAAPDPLVRQALNRAAREFFKRTRAWKEWLAETTTTAGEGVSYTFTLPSESQLLRLEKATRNGKPFNINAFNEQPVDWTKYPQGENALVSRDLVNFSLLGLFPAGDKVQTQVSLVPTLTATGIPDHLANRYLEPITAGALSKLLLTVDTPFYKPDMAGINRSVFEEEIAMATVDAFRSHSNVVPRATPSWC